MNKEEAKGLLPIIQAFADGKSIEMYLECDNKWETCYNPAFNPENKYRIKPEPKYRPFKDADECWNEMLKHQPFGWVKDKDGEYIHIVHIMDTGVCGGDDLDGFIYSSAENVYNFVDGTPFGINGRMRGMIILWIYITGAIAALIMSYYSIYKDALDYEYFHFGDLCLVLLGASLSWIGFLIALFSTYSVSDLMELKLWKLKKKDKE